MLNRLFAPVLTVSVRVLGLVGSRMVRWEGPVRVRGPATVHAVLTAAGRAAGADLAGALAAGMQPAILLDGQRLDLPAGLTLPVSHGADLCWLMPMAGG